MVVNAVGRGEAAIYVQPDSNRVRPWQRHWPRIREEVAEVIGNIVERTNTAKRNDKVLLVLGI